MAVRAETITVPAAKLASIVISLQMHRQSPTRPANAPSDCAIDHLTHPDLDRYLDLYRRIGTDWLWSWRLAMPKAELASIIHDPAVEVHVLRRNGQDEGLAELDFRIPGECELKLFGLTRPLIGTGAGRGLMAHAIEQVWSRPVRRFWVHTCSMDHPDALAFYIRSGFEPFSRHVEIEDDPRIKGILPRSAAPHVPVLE